MDLNEFVTLDQDSRHTIIRRILSHHNIPAFDLERFLDDIPHAYIEPLWKNNSWKLIFSEIIRMKEELPGFGPLSSPSEDILSVVENNYSMYTVFKVAWALNLVKKRIYR